MHYRAFKFYLISTLILIFIGMIERFISHSSTGFYFADILSILLWASYPFVVLYHFGKISEDIEAVYEKLFRVSEKFSPQPKTNISPEHKQAFPSFSLDLSKDQEMKVLVQELELMKEKKKDKE